MYIDRKSLSLKKDTVTITLNLMEKNFILKKGRRHFEFHDVISLTKALDRRQYKFRETLRKFFSFFLVFFFQTWDRLTQLHSSDV